MSNLKSIKSHIKNTILKHKEFNKTKIDMSESINSINILEDQIQDLKHVNDDDDDFLNIVYKIIKEECENGSIINSSNLTCVVRFYSV